MTLLIPPTRRLVLAGALSALPLPAYTASHPDGQFTHGVASGDPGPGSVVLWTRFVPAGGRHCSVGFEVAEDEGFTKIAARGEGLAAAPQDWCVKILADGLKPGRPYWYRFLARQASSPPGRTCTAPATGSPPLNAALFSCANLPFGYFHAYGAAAARPELDLAIHVGDYIYEYARGIYPAASAAVAGRIIEPAGETENLSGYHARYAAYRADPDLQALHQRCPMLAIWDDHEFADNAWPGGAVNHDPAHQGDWRERCAAAAQAYFDWMPVRARPGNSPLYRRMDWGRTASLILLDTRMAGRDGPLTWEALLGKETQDRARMRARAADAMAGPLGQPGRSILGAAQEAWLTAQLHDSRARGIAWQVLAQQVVMANLTLPDKAPQMLPPGASASANEAVARMMIAAEHGLGFNLDAWSGFPAARERFLAACRQAGANALVLSGDSHNAWAANLGLGDGDRPAAVEFAGGSVTSPGLEAYLSHAEPGAREEQFRLYNGELAFCDITRRGYTALRITAGSARAEWHGYNDGVRDPTSGQMRVLGFTAEASPGQGPSAWVSG